MICIPNRNTIMMKLMQSRLENIMKSKAMKKHNNLTVQKNVKQSKNKSVPGSLQNFLTQYWNMSCTTKHVNQGSIQQDTWISIRNIHSEIYIHRYTDNNISNQIQPPIYDLVLNLTLRSLTSWSLSNLKHVILHSIRKQLEFNKLKISRHSNNLYLTVI